MPHHPIPCRFIWEYGVRQYDEMMPSTGPVTWFVSHTWSRPWVELVDTVWQHYLQQPHVVCAPGEGARVGWLAGGGGVGRGGGLPKVSF